MRAPLADPLPEIFRLDLAPHELAYLLLQVDASIYVAQADQDPGRAAWYLKELEGATVSFVAVHGMLALKSLLDRMYTLTRIAR